MRPFNRSTTTIACLLTLLAISLSACITYTNNAEKELELDQTRVALAITQTALASVAVPTAAETMEQIEPPEPEPTLEPIIQATPDVEFQGISFSYDDDLASSVDLSIVPYQIDPNGITSFSFPSHYSFTFDGYALSDTFHNPIIRVYPISNYESINSYAETVIEQLRSLLQSQPSIAVNDQLPLIPPWNAAQMFSAEAAYITFQNGSGLRYLTMHGQAYYPIDNYNMIYVFQGITNDGEYLLSAILPISNPGLPAKGEDTIDDWDAFYEFHDAYIAQAAMQVDEFTADSFMPTLGMLDEMMASFLIEPNE